ncbi:zinc finger and BTB domain-containing protein 21-like [Megalops cyprinoides]|uniref:zinc finger and BTB domain-containing protein 21-like n=1 Tax=Megalops cyprinoides TaxID=118141 RepID=UPI001863E716|nr:zinc finger and BTB domain-containing protein 21-like [Megalops cyprinoides]
METLVHYTNPSHGIALLGVLNEQRMKEQLCDVILIVGDQKFRAHKSVLAASCEYFQALFARRECEARTVVQLDFCEPDAFENVLNYIYSSSLFVDKGSMAAIQELGYSLGIPYLTNILSKKPHVTYSVSRKRTSFSDVGDGSGQKSSVIVCQSSHDKPDGSSSPVKEPDPQGVTEPKQTSALKTGQPSLPAQQHCQHTECNKPNKTSGNILSTLRKFTTEFADRSPDTQPSPLSSADRVGHALAVRPQRTSSISFTESQIRLSRLQPDTAGSSAEQPLTAHNSKQASPARAGEPRRAVDRSGPLVKSLLQRSLSMDSPVPVSSPALQFNAEQIQAESVVGTLKEKSMDREHRECTEKKLAEFKLLNVKSKLHRYNDVDACEPEVSVKTEPCSPEVDSSDIIQVTVGENVPVNLKEFQINFDGGSQGPSIRSGKRQIKPDIGRGPLKKARSMNEYSFTEDSKTSSTPHSFDMDVSDGSGESRKNRKFKCWQCLKVFRSKTGFCRHVNMFHNPEKPYACDICHKRFHTNFKVWTHCQTQHGILQNPAASSSSTAAPEESSPRKLVDTAQEKETKRSAVVKYRRNKHGGLQSQPPNKRSLRSRSKIHTCPYCPEVFWLQSLFSQHLSMHAAEGSDLEAEEGSPLSNEAETDTAKRGKGKVYSCRFCGEKLSSAFELGDHERGCHPAALCPYCGLVFSSPTRKREHERHCAYKKLTCLDCMRTFKSSFSIWRHQVEVHNQNTMTVVDQLSFRPAAHNGEVGSFKTAGNSGEEAGFSDSSEPGMFDSEDSSLMVEDLSVARSQDEVRVKEEPPEEAVADSAGVASAEAGPGESRVWPCEKCGKVFGTQKHLEHHQELLCHIKPFICHICHKAFRTNFRLWSHVQTHVSAAEGLEARENDRCPSSPSPSPPPATVASKSPVRQVSSPDPPPSTVAAAGSSPAKLTKPEQETSADSSTAKMDASDQHPSPQESDSLFYHAPAMSALTFKRKHICKICHRTFKTAFSLWSHEQSHTNP